MGNIVRGGEAHAPVAQLEEEVSEESEPEEDFQDPRDMRSECESQEFSWLQGSDFRRRLATLKAEMPAFFHEGYPVDVDKTDDLLYKVKLYTVKLLFSVLELPPIYIDESIWCKVPHLLNIYIYITELIVKFGRGRDLKTFGENSEF